MTVEFIEGLQIVYYTLLIVVFSYFLYAMIANRRDQKKLNKKLTEYTELANKQFEEIINKHKKEN